MNIRAWDLIVASALGAAASLSLGSCTARAASIPPASGSWNIRPTGNAESSGELLFRVTPANGDDPVEVTVSVLSGSNEVAVARTIRRALATQLRSDRYDVQLGAGANVLVTDEHGQPNFALELLSSDVENLRVAVQSTQPNAAPTVPAQSVPAVTQPPATPAGPGDTVSPNAPPAPAGATPGTSPDSPGTNPPPSPPGATPGSLPPGTNPPPAPPGSTPGSSTPGTNAPASPNPAPPPNTTGGAGQPAAAPPPGRTH